MLTVYAYDRCESCTKAMKWLEARRIPFKTVAIRTQPPSVRELKEMLKLQGGDLGKLFNRTGSEYRELKVKDKLEKGLSEDDAVKLLNSNGNLVKRPFALTRKGGLLGFDPLEWAAKLG